MYPSLFYLHSYGFALAAGSAMGVWLAVRSATRRGWPPHLAGDLAFGMIVSGFIGARLLFVIANFDVYRKLCFAPSLPLGQDRSWTAALSACIAPIKVWDGGAVFIGGVFAAVVFAFFRCRKENFSFLRVADVFAPSLALGHVFGRIGCFAAGCCFGKTCADPNSWYCLTFPQGSSAFMELGASALFPTQLFEACGELIIFFLLLFLQRRQQRTGQIFIHYAIWYSSLRFLIEIFRGHSNRGFLFELKIPSLARWLEINPAESLLLSGAQAISLFVISAALIYYRRLKKNTA